MQLSPLQTLVLLVVLFGVVIGTYNATMDQLPDLTGTVIGNTTNNDNSSNEIGTLYLYDETNTTTNMSIIVTNETKIFQEVENTQIESDVSIVKNGTTIEVFTIGHATNTIPPQITAEKIVVKSNQQ